MKEYLETTTLKKLLYSSNPFLESTQSPSPKIHLMSEHYYHYSPNLHMFAYIYILSCTVKVYFTSCMFPSWYNAAGVGFCHVIFEFIDSTVVLKVQNMINLN
jgi:hypothetical protein